MKNQTHAQDIRKIEKELGDFLNKKFGGNVRVVSPAAQPQAEETTGTPPASGKKELINFDIKPQELIAYLDQFVVRQNRAKSVLATKVCTHFNRIRHAESRGDEAARLTGNIKSNILMMGPTGTGKTYLIKLIAQKIGVPFVKADATKFSETGYVGGDVDDLVRDLVKEAQDDIELAECGIIYIDEVDKIAASPNVIGAQISRTGVQRALLKPMEETEVDLKVPHDPVSMMQELDAFQKTGQRSQRRVNTGNILFILSGAFSGLSDVVKKRMNTKAIGFGAMTEESRKEEDFLKQARAEDLVNFGFESEFIGRIPVRCVLDSLSQEDLYQILKMPNNPVILNKRLDFSAYGIEITFEDEALRMLARRAFEENTGARGLVSAVEEALLPFEETLPSTGVKYFTVTPRIIEAPDQMLADLTAPTPEIDWKQAHETSQLAQHQYVSRYIKENWKTFSLKHGFTLSEIRCEMVAKYFCTHVMELDQAVKQVKKLHDQVKEIELEVSKSYDLNIVFEEDAIDFLIQQFIEHQATSEEILSKLYTDYYDGFNLIREKTQNNRFFLSKAALLDHETYLNDLIRKEIK